MKASLSSQSSLPQILRLEAIGEGNFGEVFKGRVSGISKHDFTIAVKALKSISTDLRDDLLREGALMAMLGGYLE